jgi:hypothetical protein
MSCIMARKRKIGLLQPVWLDQQIHFNGSIPILCSSRLNYAITASIKLMGKEVSYRAIKVVRD